MLQIVVHDFFEFISREYARALTANESHIKWALGCGMSDLLPDV